MAYDKKKYAGDELKELKVEEFPSLDYPYLGIGNVVRPASNSQYLIFLAKVKKAYKDKCVCPYCKESKYLTFDGYLPPRTIHDAPRGVYRVDLFVRPYRLLCTQCRVKFTPPIPGVGANSQITDECRRYIREECLIQPNIMLAKRCGLSDETVRLISKEYCKELDEEREKNPPIAPYHLAIDEKHIQHVMCGILVDGSSGELLDMLADNSRATMQKAIMGLKDWDKNIKVVTTDMNNSYLSWLPEFLPNATIVIDKFHVRQDVGRKIGAARKELYNRRKDLIDKIEDPEEKARQLSILRLCNTDKKLFHYSEFRLATMKYPEKMRKKVYIMDAFPEFQLLHNIHFATEHMYTQRTRIEAEAIWDKWVEMLPPVAEGKYKEWCAQHDVEPGCFDSFRSLSRKQFQGFKEYILNYFNAGCRVTNAAAESANSEIQRINSIGKGFSFEVLRARALYSSNLQDRTIYTCDVKTIPLSTWERLPVIEYQTAFMFSGESTYVFGKRKLHTSFPAFNMAKENKWFDDPFPEACISNDRLPKPLGKRDEKRIRELVWEYMEPDPVERKKAELLEGQD